MQDIKIGQIHNGDKRPRDANNNLKQLSDMTSAERKSLQHASFPRITMFVRPEITSSWTQIEPQFLSRHMVKTFCPLSRRQHQLEGGSKEWRITGLAPASVTRLMKWCVAACNGDTISAYDMKPQSADQIVEDVYAAYNLGINPGLLQIIASYQAMPPGAFMRVWQSAVQQKYDLIARDMSRVFYHRFATCNSPQTLALWYAAVTKVQIQPATNKVVGTIWSNVRTKKPTVDDAATYFRWAPRENFTNFAVNSLVDNCWDGGAGRVEEIITGFSSLSGNFKAKLQARLNYLYSRHARRTGYETPRPKTDCKQKAEKAKPRNGSAKKRAKNAAKAGKA